MSHYQEGQVSLSLCYLILTSRLNNLMMLSFGTLEISIIMKVVIAMSRSPFPSGVSYVCADINPDISCESGLNLAESCLMMKAVLSVLRLQWWESPGRSCPAQSEGLTDT